MSQWKNLAFQFVQSVMMLFLAALMVMLPTISIVGAIWITSLVLH